MYTILLRQIILNYHSSKAILMLLSSIANINVGVGNGVDGSGLSVVCIIYICSRNKNGRNSNNYCGIDVCVHI